MNIFTKKSFMKKIAILCLFLILFNFSGMNQVQAANDDSNWGGKLLGSTISLFVALADGVYSAVNNFIMGNNYFDALVEVPTTTGFWGYVGMFFVGAIRSGCRNFNRIISCSYNFSRSSISYRSIC